MGRAQFMNPRRLFAAADSLLEAVESLEETRTLIPPRESHDPGEEQATFTRVFTQDEMNEAMLMLVRMGFLGPDGRVP